MLADLAGDALQPCRRPGEGAESGHERGTPEGSRTPHQPFGVRQVSGGRDRSEVGEDLPRLERKRLGAACRTAHLRASSISRFISCTAGPIPVKIARLITECPMLSSSISEMTATGATLR